MSGIYSLKPAFVARLRWMEDVLVERRVAPDVLTATAVVISGLAGAAIVAGESQPLMWLALLPLGVARLAFNALDGAVARRLDRSTPRGAALNELGDRACDLLMFAPLIYVVASALVVTTLAAMTLTSVAGLMAQVTSGTRATSGPMGKADRVMVLGVAAVIAALTSSAAPLSAALGVVSLGCVITTVLRVRRISAEAARVR